MTMTMTMTREPTVAESTRRTNPVAVNRSVPVDERAPEGHLQQFHLKSLPPALAVPSPRLRPQAPPQPQMRPRPQLRRQRPPPLPRPAAVHLHRRRRGGRGGGPSRGQRRGGGPSRGQRDGRVRGGASC